MVDVRLSIIEPPSLRLAVSEDGVSLRLDIADFVDAGAAPYEGDYTIRPQPWADIVLPTAKRRMADDLTVLEIPYALVGNESGGKTATIG